MGSETSNRLPETNRRRRGPQVRPRYDRSTSRWYVRVKGRKRYARTEAGAHRIHANALDSEGELLAPKYVDELVDAWNIWQGDAWKLSVTKQWAAYAGDLRLDQLTPDHLEVFARQLKRKGLSPASVKHYVGFAWSVCKWAADRGWLVREPRKPKSSCTSTPDRSVPDEVVERLFSYLGHKRVRQPATRLLRFCLFTGCRPIEARLLRWEQVRWDEGAYGACVLAEHKTAAATGQERVIFLPIEARELLESLPNRAAEGWVFPSHRGEPYTKDGLRSIVRRASEAIGYHVTPYALRHTAAQSWVDGGEDLGNVAGLLGHRGLGMVQRYARIRRRRLSRAAANLTLPLQRSGGLVDRR